MTNISFNLNTYDLPNFVSNPNEDNQSFRALTFFTLFYVVVMLVGVIGNGVILLAIIRHQTLQNTANILLINSCVADLLVCIVLCPKYLYDIVHASWFEEPEILSKYLCKLVESTKVITPIASILFMFGICIERSIAITMPFKANQILKKRYVVIAMILFWTIAVLDGCYPFYAVEVFKLRNKVACQMTYKSHLGKFLQPFRLIELLMFYFIPLLVMATLYTIIIAHLIRSVHLQRRTASNDGGSRIRAKLKLTVMFSLTVLLFGILLAPWYGHNMMNNFGSAYYEIHYVILVIPAIRCLDSALNPVIYLLLSRTIRQQVRGMFVEQKKPKRIKSRPLDTSQTLVMSAAKETGV